MNENNYRLGEYRIVEYDDILLTWEGHSALGDQCSGKCFICGDVFIIGQCDHRENGYLIGEFLEKLDKLPHWDKTKYYCFASSLQDVHSGKRLTTDFFGQHRFSANINNNELNSSNKVEQGTFSLGNYQLTMADNCMLSWQTPEGLNRIIGGQGFIESGILFIDAQDFEADGQSKREFLKKLANLPQWDKTFAWGHREALKNCTQATETESSRTVVNPGKVIESRFSGNRPNAIYRAQYKKSITSLLSSSFGSLKTFFTSAYDRRFCKKHLQSLSIIVMLLVVVVLLFSSTKIFHWFHGHNKHHHEHDD
jgi:hypothetical protein